MVPPVCYIATAPSNIAFLKYWGKADAATQWPANDSLSMTLHAAHTKTKVVRYDAAHHHLQYGDQELASTDPFAIKVMRHMEFLCEALDHPGVHFSVHTTNSFPTSCGIASSASGMAALTLGVVGCLLKAESLEDLEAQGISRFQLAAWARQGSGSACRSLWGGYVSWEACAGPASQRVYPLFSASHWPLCDFLLLLSKEPKTVSSSEGHKTAWTSPLFLPRLSGLPQRKSAMIQALENRDLSVLGPLLEQEALEMHSIMLSGVPRISYLTEATCQWILRIRDLRAKTGLPVYFTIDAGPNLHLICEPSVREPLRKALQEAGVEWMEDKVGTGPRLTQGL